MCVKVIQEGEIFFLRNCEKWFKGGHALHILGGVSELLKKKLQFIYNGYTWIEDTVTQTFHLFALISTQQGHTNQ